MCVSRSALGILQSCNKQELTPFGLGQAETKFMDVEATLFLNNPVITRNSQDSFHKRYQSNISCLEKLN